MSDVNYEAVDIPDDKPPSEYHWTERRAEILQLIEKAGHPDSISPTRLADRYDVLTYRWWVSRIDCWLRFSSRPHRGVHGARVFRASFVRARWRRPMVDGHGRDPEATVRIDLDGFGHGGASMHDVDENLQCSVFLTPDRARELYEQLGEKLFELF